MFCHSSNFSNGIFITNIKEKCKIFDEYFKDQCKTIVTSSILPPHIDKITNLSLNHLNFTESNILDHIRGLNINKAHRHDGIPIRILKMCDKAISKPLFLIFKNCTMRYIFQKNGKNPMLFRFTTKMNETWLTTIVPFLYCQYVAKYLKHLYWITCNPTFFRIIIFQIANPATIFVIQQWINYYLLRMKFSGRLIHLKK